ncbi:DUF2334 domain-containing protein [Thalassobacillus devorans]|uniref:DUF2334 domain-containing protein n=1 Tax=Thalassobacillus devorans TaxID=279813 RepID=UPI000A1CB74A|nr:polysaccharide deacetylase family protein [Thalassobacillus devorans]
MIRSLFFSLIILLGLLAPPILTLAEGSEEQSPHVLVVYSNDEEDVDEYQRMLDMLVGHFTKKIEFVAIEDFKERDLEETTHLFYQGMVKENLPQRFHAAVESFDGPVVALGYNYEQLGDRFSFAEPIDIKKFNEMYLASNPEKKIKVSIQQISAIEPDENSEVLAWTKGGHITHPLVTKNDNNYYVGISEIDYNVSIILAETLHEVFQQAHDQHYQGYIRLEDIHPLVDPRKLKQVAEVLKEKEIPYMIAVIPVYVNPETGAYSHMSDYPKVLEVLKYMQKNGGTVVQHGYTHQYRATETGEGFEFWDVRNDSPIYKSADDPNPIKGPADFKAEEDYQKYLKELQAFEKSYVEEKITKGIHELSGFGLKPLAFEAPHYTMSQNGYQTVANHYSTYVGQLQLSDKDWETMDSTPYITNPSMLDGMTLLPETLGYVQPDNTEAMDIIMAKAEKQLIVRDGMLSVFYHPYLGVDKFKELLERLETLPEIDWIDLKEEEAMATTSKLTITAKDGEIHSSRNAIASITDSKLSFTYFIKNTIDKITWVMVGTGALAVVFFTTSTFVSYRRVAKEEWRDKVG